MVAKRLAESGLIRHLLLHTLRDVGHEHALVVTALELRAEGPRTSMFLFEKQTIDLKFVYAEFLLIFVEHVVPVDLPPIDFAEGFILGKNFAQTHLGGTKLLSAVDLLSQDVATKVHLLVPV